MDGKSEWKRIEKKKKKRERKEHLKTYETSVTWFLVTLGMVRSFWSQKKKTTMKDNKTRTKPTIIVLLLYCVPAN